MGERWNKMKVSFEWREGKNGVLQQSFLYENSRFSTFQKGNSSEGLNRGHDVLIRLQEIKKNFNKTCFLKAQKMI